MVKLTAAFSKPALAKPAWRKQRCQPAVHWLLWCQCLFCLVLLPMPAPASEPAVSYLPGKFVWAELVTDDLRAAEQFYGGLFGWTFAEVDGYVTASNADEPVAGLFYRPRPTDRPSVPRWISYLSSGNLQRVAKAAVAAGGSVQVDPGKIPDIGERLVLADPDGALVGAIHETDGDPEDYAAPTGSWIWLQLLSNDVQRSARFYTDVGGYGLFTTGQPGREQVLLTSDGYARAALMAMPAKAREMGIAPAWLPFIRVASVTTSAAKAVALGGKVIAAPQADLFDGRVAVLQDPAGALVGILQWDDTEAAP